MLRTIVGKNIRAVCKELGMTQKELSLYADVDKAQVGKTECGAWISSLGTLRALAFELDVTPYYLFRENDSMHTTAGSYIIKRIVSYVGSGEVTEFAGLLGSDALTLLTIDDIENGA